MINALISSQETIDNKYTLYKIAIEHKGKSWFVFRRYNEFANLSEYLKKLCPHLNLRLPPKKIFGTLDPEFIKQRKDGLNEFVSKLLVDMDIFEVNEIREFFGIDRQHYDGDMAATKYSSDVIQKDVNLGFFENKLAKPADFDFLKTIGKGSFGNVYLARRKVDGSIFAVKVLHKEFIIRNKEVEHTMSERNVLLKNLKHPFLCQLHFSFQSNTKLYFFLDFINGGELFFHLQRERKFTVIRAQFYAAEIGSALGYLHSQNIIYRDLKPENILLDSQGHIVLTDFGLCKEVFESNGITTTFCGTPEYLAPEVIKSEPYDRSIDWWSFGSVIYEMLFGLAPFYNEDTQIMYQRILHSPLPLRDTCPEIASDILLKLIEKNPKQRLGYVNDFEEVKCHPFFADIDWLNLIHKQIQPSFIPQFNSSMDLQYFDPEFQESISNSVPYSPLKRSTFMSVDYADDTFDGFSYVPPMEDPFN